MIYKKMKVYYATPGAGFHNQTVDMTQLGDLQSWISPLEGKSH